jgi:hypothetical protein
MIPSFLILMLTWAPTGMGSFSVSWTDSEMVSPVASTMGKGSTVATSIVPGSADPSANKTSNLLLKQILILTTKSILQLVNLEVPGRSQSDTGEGEEDLHYLVLRV